MFNNCTFLEELFNHTQALAVMHSSIICFRRQFHSFHRVSLVDILLGVGGCAQRRNKMLVQHHVRPGERKRRIPYTVKVARPVLKRE